MNAQAGEDDQAKRQRTAVLNNYVVLGISVGALILAGLAFVLLWSFPQMIAVEQDSPDLTNAPEYNESQAKAFIALAFAGAGVKVATDK